MDLASEVRRLARCLMLFSSSLILFAFVMHMSPRAQTLHAIVAADTVDPRIGKGASENAKRMIQLLGKTAQASKLIFNLVNLQEEAFHCDAINQALSDLELKTDDVVVFYYSGHGYRLFNDQSRFPRLACSRSLTTNPQIEEVALSLRNRKARLVLAISDSCNTFPGQFPAMMSGDANATFALRRLFDGYVGIAIIAGADYGQYSWYSEHGGEFSTQFFRGLDNEMERGDGANWDRILTISTRAREVVFNQKVYIQQPIFLSTLQRREAPVR